MMTENENNIPAVQMKLAWVVYALLTVLVVVVLVFLVAQDNEERLFYSLMAVAAAYVLRPTDAYTKDKIARFTGKDAK